MPTGSRLRFASLLWGATALLTALNVGAWFVQRDAAYANELAVTQRQLEIATDAFAEETRQMFRQIDIVLRGIRAHHLSHGSVEATEKYIDALKLGNGRIENGYLVDVQGRLVITHNPATVGRSVADRDYFQYHRATPDDLPFISAVELGRATGKYLFRVTRRIDDAQGQFAGVSLVTVAPGSIADFYARLTHSEGDIVSLIGTRDRKVRARVPAPAAAVWTRPLKSPLWDQLARNPAGRYTSPGAIDGVLRHYVYRSIPEWDMVILAGAAESQVRARAEQGLARTTAIMAGSNLVLLAFAYVLSVINRQRQRMRTLASTDALTGLPNRRALLEQGERELARAVRYDRPFTLMLLDVDHFKRVNDQFGHATGDRVLQAIGQCGRQALRALDTLGRFGGEEFLVLLPETDAAGALILAERLRTGAQACGDGRDDAGNTVAFTISIGIAGRGAAQPETLAALISRADAALYRAKTNGRNRVEVADEPGQPTA